MSVTIGGDYSDVCMTTLSCQVDKPATSLISYRLCVRFLIAYQVSAREGGCELGVHAPLATKRNLVAEQTEHVTSTKISTPRGSPGGAGRLSPLTADLYDLAEVCIEEDAD
jgi:hypothetical protein